MKIGIRLESLGLSFRRALAEAARLSVSGVQLDAVGAFAPNQLSQTGRRELRNLLRAHNVELTALGCPLRRGLDVAEELEPRIERIRQVLVLSYELGPRIVIVQAGRVPGAEEAGAGRYLQESLLALGQFGDRTGATLALETGLEPAESLAKYLDGFDTGSLGVNYDPANLFINGFDPYGSIRVLQRRIVHAHAKDARRVTANRSAAEAALGHGDLDWFRLADALAEVEYRGWLVVEREGGERLPADIEAGVKLLRRIIG
jgi:sugar phosphate isomerase/epimerase